MNLYWSTTTVTPGTLKYADEDEFVPAGVYVRAKNVDDDDPETSVVVDMVVDHVDGTECGEFLARRIVQALNAAVTEDGA